MTPKENMSDFKENYFFDSDSGAIYNGDPAFIFSRSSSYRVTANPKSAILGSFYLIKMLAGFKSLWMIPFCARYLHPFTIP